MKKNILILIISAFASVCSAESLSITGTPSSLPYNLPLGSFSPMIEFSYGGLTAQQYTLKVWLLNRGPWDCASSQWCESTYIIDNSDGANPIDFLFHFYKNPFSYPELPLQHSQEI